MTISGFTFARNVAKLNYPIKESILSILPICDEFIVALGDCDDDDETREIIESVDSDKIKIIDTVWKDKEKLGGNIYSQQTNIALDACKSDWCFYIQLDEVIHENYLDEIKSSCDKYKNRLDVDGFLFKYVHFYADYNHYMVDHKWYQREVRIIRNNANIVSVGDAQSFRKKDCKKPSVIALNSYVFHYGWVRDPFKMHERNKKITENYWGKEKAEHVYTRKDPAYDYGSLEKIPVFKGTHPAVMKDRIEQFDWGENLQYKGRSKTKQGHEKIRNIILTFLEQVIFRGSGKEPWGHKCYIIIKK